MPLTAIINLQLYKVLEFNLYYIDTGCAVIGISKCDPCIQCGSSISSVVSLFLS